MPRAPALPFSAALGFTFVDEVDRDGLRPLLGGRKRRPGAQFGDRIRNVGAQEQEWVRHMASSTQIGLPVRLSHGCRDRTGEIVGGLDCDGEDCAGQVAALGHDGGHLCALAFAFSRGDRAAGRNTSARGVEVHHPRSGSVHPDCEAQGFIRCEIRAAWKSLRRREHADHPRACGEEGRVAYAEGAVLAPTLHGTGQPEQEPAHCSAPKAASIASARSPGEEFLRRPRPERASSESSRPAWALKCSSSSPHRVCNRRAYVDSAVLALAEYPSVPVTGCSNAGAKEMGRSPRTATYTSSGMVIAPVAVCLPLGTVARNPARNSDTSSRAVAVSPSRLSSKVPMLTFAYR